MFKDISITTSLAAAKRFFHSTFVRSVVILASGTALSQLITIAVSPLLSRIYGPTDFGILGMFASLVVPLSTVACLRYEMAIMLPSGDCEEAAPLLVLSALTAIGVGVLIFIPIGVFGPRIAEALETPELQSWLYLVPVTVGIHGIYCAFRMWALRRRNFRLATFSAVTQTGSQAILQVAFQCITQAGAAGLIWGQVLGRFVGAVVVVVPTLCRNGPSLIRASSLAAIRRVAARYRSFPLYQSWGNLLSSLSRESVVLLTGMFFGAESAGLYFLGYRILNMPLLLLGGAISDVYYERGAREAASHNAPIISVRIIQILALAALPAFIVLSVIAPNLFVLLFGEPWREAGVFVQVLTPLFAVRFIASPLARAFSLYERQKAGLIWQVVYLGTSLLSLVIGGLQESIYLSLFLYSISGIVMYVIMVYLCLGYCGRSIGDIIRIRSS